MKTSTWPSFMLFTLIVLVRDNCTLSPCHNSICCLLRSNSWDMNSRCPRWTCRLAALPPDWPGQRKDTNRRAATWPLLAIVCFHATRGALVVLPPPGHKPRRLCCPSCLMYRGGGPGVGTKVGRIDGTCTYSKVAWVGKREVEIADDCRVGIAERILYVLQSKRATATVC